MLAVLCIGCAATREPEPQRPLSLLDQFGVTGDEDNPVVIMQTSMGTIVLKLNARRAPLTVRNFLSYVESGFYANTLFHRVIPGFMIQGGGVDASSLRLKPTRGTVVNEYTGAYRNQRGTIGMARLQDDLHSATCQFYINLVDNPNLDRTKYTVFGEVTMGMNVVDRIAAVPTTIQGDHQNYPVEKILIHSVMVNK